MTELRSNISVGLNLNVFLTLARDGGETLDIDTTNTDYHWPYCWNLRGPVVTSHHYYLHPFSIKEDGSCTSTRWPRLIVGCNVRHLQSYLLVTSPIDEAQRPCPNRATVLDLPHWIAHQPQRSVGPKTPIQTNLSASNSFRVYLGAVKAGGPLLARGQMYSASTQEL
jgi:hypothetical protein